MFLVVAPAEALWAVPRLLILAVLKLLLLMVILVGMYHRLPYHLLLSYRTPATSGSTANLFTEHALAKSCPLHEVASFVQQ